MTWKLYTASALSLALAACGLAGGLSNADKQAIGNEVIARLSQKKWGMWQADLCTDSFALGQPQIADATLGQTTGKVNVVVPMTAIKFYDNGPNSIPRYSVPDTQCWGMQRRNWSDQPVAVSFQYDIEKWGSGWRVAQQQGPRFVL